MTWTPTAAELLFGLAAQTDDGGVTTAEPEVHVPGPRSALVPAECPFDFPDVAFDGGALERVIGPPEYAGWAGQYSVKPDTRPCPWCLKRIDAGDPHVAVSVVPYREEPRTFSLRWAHQLCATQAGGRKVTSMATFQTTAGMPDCALCGKSYPEHTRPVTNLWDAYCGVDLPDGEYQWYQLSAPIRSRNWPYRLIVSSPCYGPMYGETENQAVERLKQEAA